MEWSSCSSSSLSEELLIEILIRVPSSREANQLKLVCKHWNSLISSNHFITCFNHRRHDSCLPPFPHCDSLSSYYSLVYQDDYCMETHLSRYRYTGRCTAEFDADHTLDLVSFLPNPQKKIVQVHSSCADLMLCSYRNAKNKHVVEGNSYFFVCNPLTKQWAPLPSPPAPPSVYPEVDAFGLLCVPSPCTLCHSAATAAPCSKFTVVRTVKSHIEVIRRGGEPVSEFNFELYSSEEGRWRSCMVKTPQVLYRRRNNSLHLVAYRGKLHWLVYGHILVYDPYDSPTRFSRVIDLPPKQHTTHPYYRVCGIGVRQDRLHLETLNHPDSPWHYGDRCIWELEDYDSGKWSLAHKFPGGNVTILPRGNGCCPPHPPPVISADCLVRVTGHWRPPILNLTPWASCPPEIVNQWWPTPVLSPQSPPASFTSNNGNTLEIVERKGKKMKNKAG